MGVNDSFTETEWNDVIAAPMIAGFAITAADPGGLWGAVKEASATAGALRDAQGANSLAGKVVEAYETAEGRSTARGRVSAIAKGKSPAEATKAAVSALAAVGHLVEEKSPAEADAFKAWLQDIAGKVAEAGTEGGFLGFGGVKVSDAERATLAEIDGVLAAGGSIT